MSILSSLYHGEVRNCPNATHNLAPGQPQDPERMEAESAAMCPPVAQQPDAKSRAAGDTKAGQNRAKQLQRERPPAQPLPPQQAKQEAQGLNCVGRSRRAWQAKLEGGLRPDLYYSGQEAVPCKEGWVESPHTVASKLESKEEFPLG